MIGRSRRAHRVLAVIALCAMGSVGCESKEPPTPAAPASATASVEASAPSVPWPSLPDNQVTLGRLVDRATRRTTGDEQPLTGSRLTEALKSSVKTGSFAGGWPAIIETLTRSVEAASRRGKRTWILVGTHHDAPDQVDAFRRLVGPLGLSPAPLAAVEQLQADGAWIGLGPEAQQGDDRLLRAYLDDGDEVQLAMLQATQRKRNYTAWKYDYVERITDVVTSARASGRPLIGCDMPGRMQQRLNETIGEEAAVLRDLHCALAVRRQLAQRPRAVVALFIGDAHLGSRRLPRFVPAADALVRVHLVGGRDGQVTLEGAETLLVTEPALVSIGEDRFALVLDAPPHAARVDRVRVRDASRSGKEPTLTVRGASGTLQIGLDRVGLDGDGWSRPRSPGPVGFWLQTAERLLAGTLDLPPGGSVVLDLTEPDVVRIERREP